MVISYRRYLEVSLAVRINEVGYFPARRQCPLRQSGQNSFQGQKGTPIKVPELDRLHRLLSLPSIWFSTENAASSTLVPGPKISATPAWRRKS